MLRGRSLSTNRSGHAKVYLHKATPCIIRDRIPFVPNIMIFKAGRTSAFRQI